MLLKRSSRRSQLECKVAHVDILAPWLWTAYLEYRLNTKKVRCSNRISFLILYRNATTSLWTYYTEQGYVGYVFWMTARLHFNHRPPE